MLICVFYRLLGNSESFRQSTFTFKFNIDAPESFDRQIVQRAVDLDDVLMCTVRFFFSSSEVKLTLTRCVVGVVAHGAANAVDFVVEFSAGDRNETLIEGNSLNRKLRLHFLTCAIAPN